MSTEYASSDTRHDASRASELVASAPFQELQRTRARVATTLTALALIAYFWRDWVRILRGLGTSIARRRVENADQRQYCL